MMIHSLRNLPQSPNKLDPIEVGPKLKHLLKPTLHNHPSRQSPQQRQHFPLIQ